MGAGRRQQSDRTAATRAAASRSDGRVLVERGYHGTSTRLAAERAGVSLGALQHHFPTKAELSVEALRFVTGRLAAEFVESSRDSIESTGGFASILDRLYLSSFADRPSPPRWNSIWPRVLTWTLQGPVGEFSNEIDELIRASAATLLPELAERPGFPALLQTSVSAIRGLALIAMDPTRRSRAALGDCAGAAGRTVFGLDAGNAA